MVHVMFILDATGDGLFEFGPYQLPESPQVGDWVWLDREFSPYQVIFRSWYPSVAVRPPLLSREIEYPPTEGRTPVFMKSYE